MSYEEFRKEILKVDKPRNHKVKGSYGVYDAYKYIRKNKWYGLEPFTEHEFYTIIRGINKELANYLSIGGTIKLPYGMGKIMLIKVSAKVKFKEGKLVNTKPIDWDKTLKLWYKDRECKDSKILVRVDTKNKFKIIYDKSRARYKNKTLFSFLPNRELKIKLKENIQEGIVDAYNYSYD